MRDAVLSRFIEACPVAALARLALQHAVRAEWVDAVSEAHAQQQDTREVLFSTVVDLMALGVSVQALDDTVDHSEPAVLRALVQASATRLAPVVASLRPAAEAPWPAGHRVRVLDGNPLPASEKRVGPLRGRRAAALPGQERVLYDAVADLVVDFVARDDAHASETTYVPALVATAAPGELWLADRHYATRAFVHALRALHAQGAAVPVREPPPHPRPTPAGPREARGRSATGVVFEQPVDCPAPEGSAVPPLRLRRIEATLDTPDVRSRRSGRVTAPGRPRRPAAARGVAAGASTGEAAAAPPRW